MGERLLALLLSIVLMLSPVPQTVYVSNAGTPVGSEEAFTEEQSETALLAEAGGTMQLAPGTTVLAFTSDVHNGGSTAQSDESAIRLETWLNTVIDIYGEIELMSFCGDMVSHYCTESAFWQYSQNAMDKVTKKHIQQVHTTGNHEHSDGNYTHNKNNTTLFYTEDAQAGLQDSDLR